MLRVLKITMTCMEMTVESNQIWSAAVALYKSGESIFPSKEYMQQLNERNKEFMEVDVWQEILRKYLDGRMLNQVSGLELLENALEIPIGMIDRKSQNRVGRIMAILGWKKSSRRLNGKQVKVYARPATVTTVAAKNVDLPSIEGFIKDNGSNNGST